MANEELEYLLYDWDEQGQYIRAHKGDWIVEEEGKCYVLTDKEYGRF
jgi:hypothetical protein